MSTEKQRKEVIKPSNNKKADLALQFQQFKQKIQEFENKNEQIINRIRDACTFKKKNIIQQQYPQRVVYYEKGDSAESANSSDQYSKNAAYNGNVGYYPPQGQQYQQPGYLYQSHQLYKPAQRIPNFHSQVTMQQYQKQQNPYYQSSYKSSKVQPIPKAYSTQGKISNSQEGHAKMLQTGLNGSRVSRDRRQTAKFWESSSQLQNRLKESVERNRELQQMLDDREQQLNRVKKTQNKFKGYISTLRRSVADQIDNYHEQVVIHRLLELEKLCKKYDNKLKNLNLKLRDVLQDRKAHRLIHRSKKNRRSSVSRNKITSQGQTKEDNKKSNDNMRTSSVSSSKKQQFAQIAAGYEAMVKNKEEEIEKLENKLREEMQYKEKYSIELKRIKISLEEKQNLLEQLKQVKSVNPPDLSSQIQNSNQLEQALIKIAKLEETLISKEHRQRQLNGTIQRLEKSKKALQEEQKQSLSKSLNKKSSALIEFQEKLRQCQLNYNKEISQLKDKIIDADKKFMQKECQILTLNNKLKKAQNDAMLKDQKLRQLESIMTKDTESDILDKSMSIDNSMMTGADVRLLQQAVSRLQDQIDHKIAMIEELEKKSFDLQNKYKATKQDNQKMAKTIEHMQNKLKNKQNGGRQTSPDKQATRKLQERLEELEQIQTEKADLLEQRQALVDKNNELLDDVKRLKEQNLSLNRQLIKVNSQVGFNQGQYSNLQEKFNKVKEELVQLRKKYTEQTSKYSQKEKDLTRQIKELQSQLQVCRQSYLEGTTPKMDERQDDNLLHSFHASEISFNINSTTNKVALEEELMALKERLRQMEANLEVKQNMEKQVQNEYKANLQKIRVDINDKNKDIQKLQNEKDQLRRQIKQLQQQHNQQDSMQNYKLSLYQQKIIQLQAENNSCKESEERLNELLHQLTQNMRQKQQQRQKLVRQLQQKERTIEQMKDIIQLRQIKDENSYRESFSLRVSADLSEDYNSQAEISYMSNISDVFKRDDVLQDKMKKGKTSREQFIRLFAKTSAYIKSLKGIISTKDKRIATLQKQVVNSRKEQNLHPSWNQAKQKTKRLEVNMFKTCQWRQDEDDLEEFKDYDSVQLDTRRSKSHDIAKELQREKQLVIEENKMLLNQIQLLQDEIARSEEQENNLVRIKDLYKDQIKKLMENNESHSKEFETQIKKLREQLDQSEAYHNWQAARQLFGKIICCVAAILDETSKGKREEKRKELQEFVKVFSSILKIEGGARDRLLASLRH